MKIIEYDQKYLEDVKDLLVELEQYIISIDEDNLDHLHPEYRDKMALLDLDAVKNNRGRCYLAIENEKAIGLIMGCIPPYEEYDYLDYTCPSRGEITELVVTSTVRSKGVGQMLIKKMEEYFKSIGCQYVIVDVFGYNKKGIHFYEKNMYHTRMNTMIKDIKRNCKDEKKMKESLRAQIINERKTKLGLEKVDTKKIFDSIINYYRKKVTDAPRNIMGYSIDIAICNMNNYNKLGKIDNLYKEWGDNFFIDLNNSAFVELEVNNDGNTESYEGIDFKDVSELNEVKNISFSLREFINLCKESDIKIKIYAKEDYDHITTLEITPYESFNMDDELNCYLKSTEL